MYGAGNSMVDTVQVDIGFELGFKLENVVTLP